MIVVNVPARSDIEILSAVPADEQGDFPVAVQFVKDGRRYMTFADDKDYVAAAQKSLQEEKVRFEDLNDLTQCILCIIMSRNEDFVALQQYRKTFEEEANTTWERVVYEVLHDIVKHRLHGFFHYGDGLDNFTVFMDILTKVSVPCKNR